MILLCLGRARKVPPKCPLLVGMAAGIVIEIVFVAAGVAAWYWVAG